MSHRTWSRHADGQLAVDALLDAAGRCFADLGVSCATMVDVARAAGCSRATLYRYFPNQDALHLAFVHRATLGIAAQMAAERDAGGPDSLVDRILSGIDQVRADPMLAVWFEPENMAVPLAVSQSSELLRSMSVGLIGDSDDSLDRDDVELRAQWLLRSIVSLLALPGADADVERSMVESFVVPVLDHPIDLDEESPMTFSCEKVGVEFFDTAPTRYTARQEVVATPDEVFAVFLDGPSWVTWALPITRVDWTSGFPIEVGSTQAVHMRGGLIGYEEFIAYEHGRRMAFRFNEASKGGIVAFAEDYRVTELSPGRCVVEWTMAMQTDRASRVASAITDPIMSFMVAWMLRRFAKLVESSPLGATK